MSEYIFKVCRCVHHLHMTMMVGYELPKSMDKNKNAK